MEIYAIVAKEALVELNKHHKFMILEAFSRYLQTANRHIAASDILARWLWERLSLPAETTIDQVLHCELRMLRVSRRDRCTLSLQLDKKELGKPVIYTFKGKSASGNQLLNTLYEYSLSYEQQKWARFVHSLKASDFRKIAPSQY